MRFKKLTAIFAAAMMALSMATTASAATLPNGDEDIMPHTLTAETYSANSVSFPLAAYPTGSYYNSYGTTACTCHGWCNWNSSCACTKFDGGTQCAGFARYIYYLANGVKCTTAESSNKTTLNTSVNSTTAKNYLQGVPTGTYVRLRTSGGTQHSVAVINTTANDITIYQANYGGLCKVSYVTYTWSDFVSRFPYLYYYVD